MSCILLWSSTVRVHDSQACRKMDAIRGRISSILELREILLSFQTGLNRVNAAIACLSWWVSRCLMYIILAYWLFEQSAINKELQPWINAKIKPVKKYEMTCICNRPHTESNTPCAGKTYELLPCKVLLRKTELIAWVLAEFGDISWLQTRLQRAVSPLSPTHITHVPALYGRQSYGKPSRHW